MSDLEAIEKRADAATPGPWRGGYPHGLYIEADVPRGRPGGEYIAQFSHSVSRRLLGEDQCLANALFAAHAREDVPALVAEVRGLREAIDAIGRGEGPCPNCACATEAAHEAERHARELREANAVLESEREAAEERERWWHERADEMQGVEERAGELREALTTADARIVSDYQMYLDEKAAHDRTEGQRDALLSALARQAELWLHPFPGCAGELVRLIAEHSPASEHPYTVDVVLHGVEPYPCVICGKQRQEHRASEQRNNDG